MVICPFPASVLYSIMFSFSRRDRKRPTLLVDQRNRVAMHLWVMNREPRGAEGHPWQHAFLASRSSAVKQTEAERIFFKASIIETCSKNSGSRLVFAARFLDVEDFFCGLFTSLCLAFCFCSPCYCPFYRKYCETSRVWQCGDANMRCLSTLEGCVETVVVPDDDAATFGLRLLPQAKQVICAYI